MNISEALLINGKNAVAEKFTLFPLTKFTAAAV